MSTIAITRNLHVQFSLACKSTATFDTCRDFCQLISTQTTRAQPPQPCNPCRQHGGGSTKHKSHWDSCCENVPNYSFASSNQRRDSMERSLSTKVSQRLTSIRRWRSTKSLDDFRPRSPKGPASASTTHDNDVDLTTNVLPPTDPLFSTFLDLGPDFSEDCLEAFGSAPKAAHKDEFDYLFDQVIQEEDETAPFGFIGVHDDFSTTLWQDHDSSGQTWETQSQQHSVSDASKRVCTQCLQAQFVNDLVSTHERQRNIVTLTRDIGTVYGMPILLRIKRLLAN